MVNGNNRESFRIKILFFQSRNWHCWIRELNTNSSPTWYGSPVCIWPWMAPCLGRTFSSSRCDRHFPALRRDPQWCAELCRAWCWTVGRSSFSCPCQPIHTPCSAVEAVAPRGVLWCWVGWLVLVGTEGDCSWAEVAGGSPSPVDWSEAEVDLLAVAGTLIQWASVSVHCLMSLVQRSVHYYKDKRSSPWPVVLHGYQG